MPDREALLTLYLIPSIGPSTLFSLKEQFGVYSQALAESTSNWNVHRHIKAAANTFLTTFSLSQFLDTLERLQQNFITWDDPEYPDSLRNIASPPPVLFYQGNLPLLQSDCIAVVGTRHPSSYAERVVNSFVPALSYRYTIVSGFQKGVDQLAHHSAIESGGKTIAVLGTGIDIDYPSDSQKLRQTFLSKSGLFISEFPPHTPPEKGNFPRRNRIASGLATSVIVIEAAIQSGSLVTAKHAVEQGKDVYAVPGSVFAKYCEGTNYLLKQGAKVLTTPQDILGGTPGSLFIQDKIAQTSESLTGWTKQLYHYLAQTSSTLDDCIEKFQRPTTDILSALTEMELTGLIHKQDNGTYAVV